MSIPGVSMEAEEQPDPTHVDDAQAAVADEPDDDALVPTVQVGTQQMVPVGELIKFRKEARASKRELDAIRPQLERANALSTQLEQVQPFIEQLQRMTPQQRADLAAGRVPSPEGTRQPADDVEAREYAEDLGLIAQDGSLDIRRARARLDKDNARFEQVLQRAVAPVRQQSAQQQAATLRSQAKGIKGNDGAPMATAESIDEAYGMLPPELASQPNVAMVAIGTAMLIDKMKGRKPKGDDAYQFAGPIYSEPAGGRRSGTPALTAEDRASAKRVGLTDADMTAAASALSKGGRGISME